MTDFDRMIAMLRDSKTPDDDHEIVVKTFYDSMVDRHFTDICIGKRPDGAYPDIIFSFDEDTEKLSTVWP